MASWCNARLTVVGETSEVARFAHRARKKPPELGYVPDILVTDSEVIRLPRPQGRPTDIFIPDMWVGEGGDLWADRIKAIGDGLSQKKYHFQIRNNDGREHFRKVSLAYPSLHFVLADHWDPPDECRSFLIHSGRTKAYVMPDELMSSILTKYGYDPDLESDNDDDYEENYWKEYEASFEMMDVAEAYWLDGLLRRITRPHERASVITQAASVSAR